MRMDTTSIARNVDTCTPRKNAFKPPDFRMYIIALPTLVVTADVDVEAYEEPIFLPPLPS